MESELVLPYNIAFVFLTKANKVLLRECTGRSKHLLPITQETTLHIGITRWSIPKSD